MSRFNSKFKRWLPIAGISIVLATALGFASLAGPDSREDTTRRSRALAVETVSVEPVTSYQATREFTGTIMARRVSEIGFELTGKLTDLNADEGQTVTKGAILAGLDTAHLETNRRKVVARRAQAEARLDEMLNGPREEDIDAARARVESLQAQVEQLKLQTSRQEKLVRSSATSRAEYEQTAFGLKAREAQLREAEHNLDELLNGTRKEQIEIQRSVVAELDAAIADIDVDLRKSTLKAPFDGTIARRWADNGTVVELGRPVFRLIEDHALEAWIGLPVQTTHRIGDGTVQRVKINGERFHATVSARFPEVDPATRTRTIVLTLDDSAAGRVVHGQVVRLELEETVEANGYWLPSTALTKGRRGLWTAFVVDKTAAHQLAGSDTFRVARRDVEILHTESDQVLVRGTLGAGDRVISSGTHRVVPDQLVRISK